MDGQTLATLVDERFTHLTELIGLSQSQFDAIRENQMTDLMRILSHRQRLIDRLAQIGIELQSAVGDDPMLRPWPSEETRLKCREQQEKCDQMHRQLMDMETECETMLQKNRTDIEGRIERLHDGHRAATGYAQAGHYHASTAGASQSGSRLDLSSD